MYRAENEHLALLGVEQPAYCPRISVFPLVLNRVRDLAAKFPLDRTSNKKFRYPSSVSCMLKHAKICVWAENEHLALLGVEQPAYCPRISVFPLVPNRVRDLAAKFHLDRTSNKKFRYPSSV